MGLGDLFDDLKSKAKMAQYDIGQKIQDATFDVTEKAKRATDKAKEATNLAVDIADGAFKLRKELLETKQELEEIATVGFVEMIVNDNDEWKSSRELDAERLEGLKNVAMAGRSREVLGIIAELKNLFDRGAITEQEFERMKKEILDKI